VPVVVVAVAAVRAAVVAEVAPGDVNHSGVPRLGQNSAFFPLRRTSCSTLARSTYPVTVTFSIGTFTSTLSTSLVTYIANLDL
jgi:hypothetical protein